MRPPRPIPLAAAVWALLGALWPATAADLGYPASALGEFSPAPPAKGDLGPDQGADLGPAPTVREPLKPPPHRAPRPSAPDRPARCVARIDGLMGYSGPCRVADGSDGLLLVAQGRRISLRESRGGWRVGVDGRDLGFARRRGDCWLTRRLRICKAGAA
jgi:hypothetical protein